MPRSSAVSGTGRASAHAVSRSSSRPATTSSTNARSASSPSRRPNRGRGRAHLGQPRPVVRQRDHRPLDPLRGQLGVVDQQAAAGLDHRQRVAPLLTVTVRQRHVDGRQADRGRLGAASSRRPGTAPGRPRRSRAPSRRCTAPSRTAPAGRAGSPPARCAHRCTCSTWMPAAVSALAAPAIARLIDRAPCEAPKTNSVGRCGSQPEVLARAAPAPRGPVQRGDRRCAAARRSPGRRAATATCCGWYGKPTATCLVNRMPILLATPGGTFTSWITIGVSPPPRGQVGRHRDVAAEADHDVGLDVVEDRPGRPASTRSIRSGVATRSMLTERGSW